MSSFITTSATQAVFELVLARPVVTEAGDHPNQVHLWWRAPQQGNRVVQVYLDDVLVDVVLDPAQREFWLTVDRSIPKRIELLAVDADDRDAIWREQPQFLTSWVPHITSHASVTLVRNITLPIDTNVQVRESGTLIDEGALWPSDEHRSGFGAVFGEGAFGFDDATGPGLGLGQLGMGPIGVDASAWRWRRGDLDEGDHAFELHAQSRDGEPVTNPITLATQTLERLPVPATNLQMLSDFTLTWNPS